MFTDKTTLEIQGSVFSSGTKVGNDTSWENSKLFKRRYRTVKCQFCALN
jgi:hypothetical protein